MQDRCARNLIKPDQKYFDRLSIKLSNSQRVTSCDVTEGLGSKKRELLLFFGFVFYLFSLGIFYWTYIVASLGWRDDATTKFLLNQLAGSMCDLTATLGDAGTIRRMPFIVAA